jgi:alpha-glucosidase
MLHLYRSLLAARRASPALRRGSFRWVDGPSDDVLVYDRVAGDDGRRIAVNMGAEPVDLDLTGWTVDLESRAGALTASTLAPDCAVLLRR